MTSPETEIDDKGQDASEKPKLTLEVQVDKSGACQRHITVTVAREDVDRYLDEAYSELMRDANVPGFRSGRAPRKLVEQRFREQVTDQVKGSLLMDAMSQVSDEHEFSAIGEPEFDFDAIELPDSGPLKFEFDLEVRPEFDMPKWKGLSLEKLTREFSQADIEYHLREMLSEYGELVDHDGKAELHDFVMVNIAVQHKGQEIARSEDAVVQIKPIVSFPDARLEGFDKLMIGAQAGDKKSVQVMISHDASVEDLQGEEVDVEFEVVGVQKLELPEMDEDFLANLGGIETEGELRDRVKETLERRMNYQQQRRTRQQITSLLTQSADWDLPPDLLKRQSHRELDRAMLEMRSSGFSDEEIKAYENELKQNSLASTKTALQEHFILERIAEDEGIDAEPADYDTEIASIAYQSGEPLRRVRARIEKKGLMDALRNQIIERKVMKLIEEHAKFKAIKYEPESNETVPLDLPLSGRDASQIPSAKHGGGESQPLQQPVDRT